MAVASSDWSDLDSLHAQSLMLTDAQTPFLGTPSVPLQGRAIVRACRGADRDALSTPVSRGDRLNNSSNNTKQLDVNLGNRESPLPFGFNFSAGAGRPPPLWRARAGPPLPAGPATYLGSALHALKPQGAQRDSLSELLLYKRKCLATSARESL